MLARLPFSNIKQYLDVVNVVRPQRLAKIVRAQLFQCNTVTLKLV
jgi:hypothetical protein